jgi:hypothetical protein
MTSALALERRLARLERSAPPGLPAGVPRHLILDLTEDGTAVAQVWGLFVGPHRAEPLGASYDWRGAIAAGSVLVRAYRAPCDLGSLHGGRFAVTDDERPQVSGE